MTLGEKIRFLRGKKKDKKGRNRCLSLRDLAADVGITASHLCRVEKNQIIPTEKVLRNIAVALDTQPLELLVIWDRLPKEVHEFIVTSPNVMQELEAKIARDSQRMANGYVFETPPATPEPSTTVTSEPSAD